MANMNKNKVKFGLKNVHYALITETGFGEVKKLPGAVNLSIEPKGDDNEFFADDGLYYADTSNQGYEGTLELALVPDQFKIDVFGFKVDNKGVLIENKDAKQNTIALLFEINGDKNETRHVLYNVTCKRGAIGSATETTSKDIKSESLSIKVSADHKNGNITARSSKGDQAYDTFFESVYVSTGV